MRSPQSLRAVLGYSALLTVGWLLITVQFQDAKLDASLALTGLMFFAIIFFTMRVTNRLTATMADRIAKRAAARSGVEGSAARRAPATPSERPEHALRRRARRPRGTDRRRR